MNGRTVLTNLSTGAIFRAALNNMTSDEYTHPTNYIYIGKNGNDSTGDGSAFNPYLTVGKGITIATSGTTLFIYPGTYTENLTFKAGVNLTAPVTMGVTITGNHVCTALAGTIVVENIVFSSASGDTLAVTGATILNLQLYNSSSNSATGYAINWNSTSASSKLSLTDCTVNTATSGASACAIYSPTGAKGSIIANRTSFVIDNSDHVCLKLGGAVTFTHTSDQIVGQVVMSDTAAAVISLVKINTSTVPVATIASGASVIANSIVLTTTASPAVTGAGGLFYAALVYGSTGVGGAQTLNAGAGPIPLKFGPISLRVSPLNSSPYDGTWEYDGTYLYFTSGTTRKIISDNTRMIPLADGTTALSITNAAGTALFYFDTTNGALYPASTNAETLGSATKAFKNVYTRLVNSDDTLAISSAATKAASLTSGTTGAASIDSGTTGAVNVGTGASAKTVTIGNVTGATAVVYNAGSGKHVFTGTMNAASLASYASNALAITGGLVAGDFYRNGDNLCVVH
jgi:trimeric autotransporter adhesin